MYERKRSAARKVNRKILKILHTSGQLAFEAVAHDMVRLHIFSIILYEISHNLISLFLPKNCITFLSISFVGKKEGDETG